LSELGVVVFPRGSGDSPRAWLKVTAARSPAPGQEEMMSIDVHKKMLAVVVSDVEVDGEYRFERRKFGSNPEQLRSLAAWL
jgi:hypothetical protein